MAYGSKAPRLTFHVLVRFASALILAGAAATIASHSNLRVDATSEQIHSLSADTRKFRRRVDAKNPVFIDADPSPECAGLVSARKGRALISTLREFDAVAGESLHTRIIETAKYTPQAREALERYNIRPFRVPATEESSSLRTFFIGLVFASGGEEFVIPFLDCGLPVEYELMCSIRVVSRAKRRRFGVLTTQAKLFGGFDFERKRVVDDIIKRVENE